jgi:hypothetical protein
MKMNSTSVLPQQWILKSKLNYLVLDGADQAAAAGTTERGDT